MRARISCAKHQLPIYPNLIKSEGSPFAAPNASQASEHRQRIGIRFAKIGEPPPTITSSVLQDGAWSLNRNSSARLEGTEVRRRRGCPEIDLAQVRLPSQHLEPVSVRDGDDEIDAHGQFRFSPGSPRVNRKRFQKLSRPMMMSSAVRLDLYSSRANLKDSRQYPWLVSLAKARNSALPPCPLAM